MIQPLCLTVKAPLQSLMHVPLSRRKCFNTAVGPAPALGAVSMLHCLIGLGPCVRTCKGCWYMGKDQQRMYLQCLDSANRNKACMAFSDKGTVSLTWLQFPMPLRGLHWSKAFQGKNLSLQLARRLELQPWSLVVFQHSPWSQAVWAPWLPIKTQWTAQFLRLMSLKRLLD